jgi:YgiT-type zinc finger domain-containing protein
MQELVDEAQAQGASLCPGCEGKLRYKGKGSKRVVTLRGEVEVKRDYDGCNACGTGYFPPG